MKAVPMPVLMKFLHLLAAVAWLGGIGFMLLALRPAAAQMLAPPQRLALTARALQRFFALVWFCIAILLTSGLAMLLSAGMRNAPLGWHAMLGLGLLMSAVFGHIYFGPFRRLQRAVSAADWPEGGRHAGRIAALARLVLGLGVVAIAAVFFMV